MKRVEFGLRAGLLEIERPRHTSFPIDNSEVGGSLLAASQIYRLSRDLAAPVGLFDLLRSFQSSLASDPRDKVFALFGIALPLDKTGSLHASFESMDILPDYRVDFRELALRVARGILQQSQDLRILSLPSGRADWPSWVPDWSSTSNKVEVLSSGGSPYKASGDSLASP